MASDRSRVMSIDAIPALFLDCMQQLVEEEEDAW